MSTGTCFGCKNKSKNVCPNSEKDCGHHSNTFWILGFCDWCDAEDLDSEDFLENNESEEANCED